MIVDLVLTIIHLIFFLLHAFSTSSTVVSFLGLSESAIVKIATVIDLFFLSILRSSLMYCLNVGTSFYFSSFTSSLVYTFLPILYFANKFQSPFSLKGKTLI